MCTPTVTERSVILEPTTRDDFADSPAMAPATADRRPAPRFTPQPERSR